MNIAINASSIGSVKGGASFYMVHITRALTLLDKKNRYTVFCTDRGVQYFSDLPTNATVVPVASKNILLRLMWEQIVLPLVLCEKYDIEVLFSPNYTSPILKFGLKTVVTIHDLSFFPLSKLYPLERRLFKPIIKMSVACSDKVIAVSNHTKNDIIRYVGDYKSKIFVIYNAAGNIYKEDLPRDIIANTKKKYSIKNEYILFTGFLEPRKNLDRLIDAFSQISNEINHMLVIIGGRGWWYESTYKKVDKLKINNRVIFTGYVSDGDLPMLYAGATLFAFPSLYEGFGMSALESICCGTPVLASNNSALPEVVQDAGVYVNPFDVKDISVKMLDVLKNPSKISGLKANCKKVSKQFSWSLSAKKTLEVLTSN